MAIYTWFLWLSSSQWQMFLDCRCRNVTGHPVRLPKMMLITASALLRSRCSSSRWEIESRVAPTLSPLLYSHWECKWPKGHICLSLHLSLWPRIPEFPVNKSSMSLSLIVGECTLAEGWSGMEVRTGVWTVEGREKWEADYANIIASLGVCVNWWLYHVCLCECPPPFLKEVYNGHLWINLTQAKCFSLVKINLGSPQPSFSILPFY